MLHSIISQLSAEALADKLHHQEDITIIDIRDTASYEKGHIDGAIHLTQENLGTFMQHTAKDQPIIVCCYHGISSQQVARYLQGVGFTQLHNLTGGYEAWLNQ